MILEKVWAKLHGDYVKIIGGLCEDTFRDLTGAPSFTFYSNEETHESMFAIL